MKNQEVQLERLRAPEVAERLNTGWTTALFACGAVEQHGPHMPLFMDAEHGTTLALRLAKKLGNTLVAPTIRIGCSDHHMPWAGSMTLRQSTFEAMVSDYVTSLAHHGFKNIFIIPTHGGNFNPLKEMEARLKALAPNSNLKIYTELTGLIKTWKIAVEKFNGLGARVGGHADIAETAIMLAMHPELVRMDLAEPGFSPELDDEVINRIIKEGFKTVTPNGILGDPNGATAELGAVLLEVLAEELVAFFQS